MDQESLSCCYTMRLCHCWLYDKAMSILGPLADISPYSTPRHVTSAWSSKLVPWHPHGDSHVMISDQLFLSYRSFDRLSVTWKSVQEGNIQAALQYYPAMHRGVWWITVILPSCILLDTIINWKLFHLVVQAVLLKAYLKQVSIWI